jgi:hypothetical protein
MDFYGACPDISAKRNDEIMKKKVSLIRIK